GLDVFTCPCSRGAGSHYVSYRRGHHPHPEHLQRQSAHRIGLRRAVSAVRFLRPCDSASDGGDESRFLARQPERAGLEITPYAGLCRVRAARTACDVRRVAGRGQPTLCRRDRPGSDDCAWLTRGRSLERDAVGRTDWRSNTDCISQVPFPLTPTLSLRERG